ncbi:hypothetical protein [Kitasatospora sp. NPDC050543]|uniref:hypothetical protein n=1 Tax=Kitasatospora sp. NPDC050543 TaxID=3364054 RepID=UPI0037B49A4C
MSMEAALLESRTLRGSLSTRIDVLDKVKILMLLPDGVHVTTRMVADYFEVGEDIVRQLVVRHRAELSESGVVVLRGADLRSFESDNMSLSIGSYPQARRSLTVYPRRAVLNIAMLLRDSEVARRVRGHLLDVAEAARRSGPSTWAGEEEPRTVMRPRRRRHELHWDEYEALRRDPEGEAWRRKIDGLEPFDPPSRLSASGPSASGPSGRESDRVPAEERFGRIESRLDAHGAVIMAMGERLCQYGEDLRAVRGDIRMIRRDIAELRRARRR